MYDSVRPGKALLWYHDNSTDKDNTDKDRDWPKLILGQPLLNEFKSVSSLCLLIMIHVSIQNVR